MSTLSSTDIANLALARVGETTISNIDTDTSVPAQKCRLFYAPDRDALLEAYWWRFAAGRASLAQSVSTPSFEYDYAFALPNDFLCLRTIWDECADGGNLPYTCAIEGQFILSNESTMKIRYTKRITDTTKFSEQFIQCLKTRMALDLLYALSRKSAAASADRLQIELDKLLVEAKMATLAEQNRVGRYNRTTWNDARRGYTDTSLANLGS